MGSGILPTCIYKNKIYFLFGKENEYADTPGWSDFGGGTDNSETHMQTAIREGGEELTGFLGSDAELSKLLKKTFHIDYNKYRLHIFKMDYDPLLQKYYNNNQKFLQKHLDKSIIKKTKIFEKSEIKWICIDNILKMRKEFRSYFQNIIDMIYNNKSEIYKFINNNSNSNNNSKKNKKNITRKNKK